MKEPGWPHGGRPKARRAWSLWKTGRVAECEVKRAHSLGAEARVYVGGAFQSARVCPSVEDAEREAKELRREFMATGWAERPPILTDGV